MPAAKRPPFPFFPPLGGPSAGAAAVGGRGRWGCPSVVHLLQPVGGGLKLHLVLVVLAQLCQSPQQSLVGCVQRLDLALLGVNQLLLGPDHALHLALLPPKLVLHCDQPGDVRRGGEEEEVGGW